MHDVVPHERIEGRIHEVRGRKVMLDSDLAEARELKSQSVTSSWGGRRSPPHAFSEHGILMLSNVLKSERAFHVSIQIIRVSAKMREMAEGYRELVDRIQRIERRQDVESREIWKAIRLIQGTLLK